MKSKWIVSLLAAAGLLVAMTAFAADAAKRTPSPDVRKDVVRVVEPGDGDGELEWESEDGFDEPAFAGDEEGGDGDRRIVIRRRTGPGGLRALRGLGMGRGLGRHGGMGRGFAALDLTDAQRERLAAIHERQARRGIQARADLQLARLDLRKLMRAEAPNTAAINAQIDRLARMRADLQKSHVATRLEARAVLTPEQRKQLREAGPGAPGRRMQRLRQGSGSQSD